MRKARAADWQRRLSQNADEWPLRLERFSFSNIPSLGSAEIPFFSPLTVISGPNGVGKTTLLRAIWASLAPEAASVALAADLKLVAGRAGSDLRANGGTRTGEVEFYDEGLRVLNQVQVAVTHIDSAAESYRHRRAFSAFENGEDIINGVGVRELDATSLAELNYIVHREYRSVSLYEVEMDGVVPYFEVAYGNDRYDSRTMGAGESAAFYLWWMLNRAEDGSILLIEEPEAFLSFACQESIANHLVSVVVKKKICAVITSHSAPLILSMPRSSLRFLVRGQGGMQLIGDQPPPILLKSIGIDPPLAAVLFVEDEAARSLSRGVLERLDPSLARRVIIEVRSGHGEVTTALRLTGKFQGALKYLGLYDGDSRPEVPNELISRSAFLPGNQAIEAIFRELIQGNPDSLAEMTGNPHLSAILAALEGADHHDWYEEVCKELGLTKTQLFPMMFSIWMRVPENIVAATATYEAIVALIRPERGQ